jgi:mono/diheme cytochrome c family protein
LERSRNRGMSQHRGKTRFAKWTGITVWILSIGFSRGSCLGQSSQGQEIRHGQTIYRIYCVVCHGDNGHGDGPTSSVLKVKVPDLTEISKRNNGVFPLEHVQRKIDGTEPTGLAHGTREMPIFGPVFTQTGPSGETGKTRVRDLTKYLQSIQTRTSRGSTSKSPSGT